MNADPDPWNDIPNCVAPTAVAQIRVPRIEGLAERIGPRNGRVFGMRKRAVMSRNEVIVPTFSSH